MSDSSIVLHRLDGSLKRNDYRQSSCFNSRTLPSSHVESQNHGLGENISTNLKAHKNHPSKDVTPDLSAAEVELAEDHLFAHSQQCSFSENITTTSRGKPIKSSSCPFSLNSTIGSGGLIRVSSQLTSFLCHTHRSIPSYRLSRQSIHPK